MVSLKLSNVMMHISDSRQLHVVDRDNERVQVFDAESGSFFLKFGQSQFSNPNGITTNKKFCYVTYEVKTKYSNFVLEILLYLRKVREVVALLRI